MTPEWQPSAELAQAAIDAEPADPLAFWRGLAWGLLISAVMWLMGVGGVWVLMKGTM